MTNTRSASAAQPAPSPAAQNSPQSRVGAAQSVAAERPAPVSRSVRLPGEDLSLNEMMRVMDVAREMRRSRDVAEEMFRRDDTRAQLRNKLMRSAEIAGDRVSEADIDAAIDHYFKNLHTYADPEPSFQRTLAHAWVWRWRIAAVVVPLVTLATAAAVAFGGLAYMLF
jgi:hypothetical protein